MGVSCFREVKFILRWPPLSCFKKTCVHLVVDEESELAPFVSPLLFLQVKLGGIKVCLQHTEAAVEGLTWRKSEPGLPYSFFGVQHSIWIHNSQLWKSHNVRAVLDVKQTPLCLLVCRNADPRVFEIKTP